MAFINLVLKGIFLFGDSRSLDKDLAGARLFGGIVPMGVSKLPASCIYSKGKAVPLQA